MVLDKWKEMNLTPGKARLVNAPTVIESPVNIECKVKEIIHLGTHDMFISEVVNVIVEESLIDNETGKFMLSEANPLVYNHGEYFKLGKRIGKFGWSVEKKPKRKPKK